MFGSLVEELRLEAVKKAVKIKSNDRMPAPTRLNLAAFMDAIHDWNSPHRKPVLALASKMSEENLFELMHSIRRWYTGQTMAKNLIKYNDVLSQFMRLDPSDAVGSYRGFKVPNDDPMAKLSPGDKLVLNVTRNRGISSWSTNEEPTHRFSGGGKGKTGIIVKLIDGKGIKPILAPPSHTEKWFNEFYSMAIGQSFRPKENEYLIAAPKVRVEVIRVKK